LQATLDDELGKEIQRYPCGGAMHGNSCFEFNDHFTGLKFFALSAFVIALNGPEHIGSNWKT
jgi:hypothetical protein